MKKENTETKKDEFDYTALEESSCDLGRSLDAMKLLCDTGEHEVLFTEREKWDREKMVAWLKLLRLSLDEATRDLKRVQALY